MLSILSGCCNATATAAATCSMLYAALSAAASSFYFLYMVLRTVLLLATSITIGAAALLLALPLAQALPLQRGSSTLIPPYIHNACYGHVSQVFHEEACSPVPFSRIILGFFVIFRHSKSGSSRFTSNLSNRPKDNNR